MGVGTLTGRGWAGALKADVSCICFLLLCISKDLSSKGLFRPFFSLFIDILLESRQ